MKYQTQVVLDTMCATCPWRPGSEYAFLKAQLEASALTESNRVCHCTGSSAIHKRTGKRPALCRGARTVQLKYFHRAGLIAAPTDQAWNDALAARNMPAQQVVTMESLTK